MEPETEEENLQTNINVPSLNCLICSKEFALKGFNSKGSSKNPEELSNLFKILCQHMKWTPLEPEFSFDFDKELFPFCTKCQRSLVILHNLQKKLDGIHRRINSVTANLAVKILDIKNNNPTENIICSIRGGKICQTNPNKQNNFLENVDPRVEHYRRLTYNRYSAIVNVERNVEIQAPNCDSMGSIATPTAVTLTAEDVILSISGQSEFYLCPVGNVSSSAEEESNNILLSQDQVCDADLPVSDFVTHEFGYEDDEMGEDGDANDNDAADENSTIIQITLEDRSMINENEVSDHVQIPPALSSDVTDENLLDSHAVSNNFNNNKNLKRRRRLTHNKKNWKCTDCKANFTEKHLWNKHLPICPGSPPSEATESLRYMKSKCLVYDILQTGEFQCRHCKQLFPRKDEMFAHIRTHRTGTHCKVRALKLKEPIEEPTIEKIGPASFLVGDKYTFEKVGDDYKCSECPNYTCQNFRTIRYHVHDVHIEPYRFICETCGKKFSTNKILLRHQQRHRSDFPLVCETCGKGFRSRPSLRRHLQAIHPELNPIQGECNHCGQKFGSMAMLRNHYKKHERIQCEVCGKDIGRQNINKHMETHKDKDTRQVYSCDICGLKLSHAYNVLKHKRIVHNPNKTTKTYNRKKS